MKKRKVYSGEVHHVYQRTVDRGLIFYNVHDYLVFFTIFCSQARQHAIQVMSLCPMPDHIHQVLVAPGHNKLVRFEQCYSHLFAREWNRARKKKGYLFQHPFGSAAKLGSKQVRTALAYCNNNPVERKLAEIAEDYRWTFLAYYGNKSPYSPKLNTSRIRAIMHSVLQEVNTCYELGQYLHYNQLRRWERYLTVREWQQLTDYIIGLWNVIDYEQAISYYGSFKTMIGSFHDNTGSEYDIKEERDNYSDAVYADCTHALLNGGFVKQFFDIPTLPDKQKDELFLYLQQRTSARPRQIKKYLHINLNTNR